MELERITELLKIEKECVLRNSKNLCDRNCASCDLVQTDEDILEMYSTVISLLEYAHGAMQYTTDVFFNKICFIKKDGEFCPVGVITAVDLTNLKQFEFGVTPFDQILTTRNKN